MEANAEQTESGPSADRAERIIEAMRTSVAEVGIAGSTFERVAAKAGVSRGLLHYYFGTKERLLIEVIRRDTEERIESLRAALEQASSVDEIIIAFSAAFARTTITEQGYAYLVSEVFIAGRNKPEVQAALAELYERGRTSLAEVLRAKEREGILKLRLKAEAILAFLFSAGDGAVIQRIVATDRDFSDADEVSWEVARFLLDARA
jgi:AcrR family transcriptional regulator